MEKETYHPLGGALHCLDRSLMLLHVFLFTIGFFSSAKWENEPDWVSLWNVPDGREVSGNDGNEKTKQQPITTQFLLAFSIMIFLL